MINFFTICLDGMPYITNHLPMMNRLPFDWKWVVIEGVAKPVNDTSWCKEIESRLSKDGTSEYIESIADHPHVYYVRETSWKGKTEMCNRALALMDKPGLLWQIDADELWESWQVLFVKEFFDRNEDYNTAQFYCRYFVGKNIMITSLNNYGNRETEWKRTWRYEPGMRFKSHEPPKLENLKEKVIDRKETSRKGLVFDHPAYSTRAQVAFKEEYYGYEGAVAGWDRLQKNKKWPVTELKDFLPWVDEGVTADLVHK